MCRQFPHRAPAPDVRPADRDRARPRIGRRTAALIATGLLTGLGIPPTAAQQTPDAWSAERRAVLPSGLTVQFDYAAVPGVSVDTAPGRLADRPGDSGSPYTDGIRPGDPAETFRAAERRPGADGSWHTLGTLQLSFSRPVRNPRLHVSGLAGKATSKDGSTGTSTRLTVTGGSPAAPALVGRTGWRGWAVGSGELAPAPDAGPDGSVDGTGTLELAGTVSTVSLRVEQRSTAENGSTTPPAPLRQAYTVTLDEGLGSAPQDYGNVSHLVSDLFLGQDAATTATRARPGLAQTVERPLQPGPPASPPPPAPDAGPVAPSVEIDGGESRRSPWASPPPPLLQPGRAEYQGADPTLSFPAETAVGRSYHLDVPVNAGSGPAVLAGWIDFDHNGRFDPLERVQTEVPAGADRTALEWQVPAGATGGDTWVRLRLARSGAQVVTPGGFADSGQVVDQKVGIAIGAAKPQVGLPIPGSTTREPRPEFRGDGAVAGASIAVQENGATLCTAKAGNDGSWNCRPDQPLTEGTHTLVPVETTRSGMVLRGDEFRLTVRTTPPTAPVLTLPAYTNDPGLLLTGLGEPGSTVTVTAGTPGRDGGELCSTAVAADGTWSCLPVENLADGRYQLTPRAADGAGNRSDGKAVALTVDTAAPDRPQLTAPGSGELLHTARPRITGRAEPGTTVTVTAATGHGDERTTICSAVTAADGTWSCTPARDLTPGDLTLLATATDPAGNGTPGDPVPVHLAATAGGGASASPSPSAEPSASASASPAAADVPSASASVSVSASDLPSSAAPSPAASDVSVPIVVPPTDVPAGVDASPTPTSAPSPSASASASGAPSSAVPSGSPAVSSSPAVPDAPVPPEVLPIVVPPTGVPAGADASPTPTSAPSPSASTSASAFASASASAPGADKAVEPELTLPVPSDLVPIVVPTPDASTASAPPSPSVLPDVPSAPGVPATPSPSEAHAGAVPPTADPTGGQVAPVPVPPGAPARPVQPATATPSRVAPPATAPPATTAPPVATPPVGTPLPPVAPSATRRASADVTVLSAPPSPAPAGPAPASAPLSPSASPSVQAPAPSSDAPSALASDPAHAPDPGSGPEADGDSAPDDPADEAVQAPPQSRTPAAPPPDVVAAAHRAAATGWRGLACGALLVAAGVGLLTRRVFGRGSGTRRR
ncbi:Ig-like domain-containing protein [Kitasatospora fiedleri]|uniref:Ig-like domain-containing protein n=1 Tax=Kitasatospora fiedleri TaxID=2991545 RepID=UPI00249CAFF2|nr:Ig-like domain-containing protein [Kitasatospora fiedleri]